MKYQCKNCKTRKIGCHQTCSKYQKDKLIRQRENKQRRLEFVAENHTWSYQRKNK